MQLGIGVGIGAGSGAVSGGGAPVLPLISDTFSGGDSTTTLGASYTSDFGTWGVISGKAYCVSDASGAIVSREAGAVNYRLSFKVSGSYGSTNRSNPLIIFRRLDASNFLQVGANAANTSLEIQKRDAGAFSSVVTTPLVFTNGQEYSVSIVCNDVQITVSIDGVQRLTHTLAGGNTKYAGATYTKVGMRFDKAGTPVTPARWDDLIVESL
ncbi:hypothetical protein [Paenibacillus silvisoli]|uniref:hypothetical protein n=1 Tax=Paenibacillus silvisoli TaxID=3110539 RepID=UPI0028063E58|nr:hypothetical protein [Paenibacillus silvisoli]